MGVMEDFVEGLRVPKTMSDYLQMMEDVKRENLVPSGPEWVEQHHAAGKFTARERIELLVDPGSFEEEGSFVRDVLPPLYGEEASSAAEGVVLGLAKINGRPVVVWATDPAVLSGSIGDQGAWKIHGAVQYAGRWQVPVIGIVDSIGTRFDLKDGGAGVEGFARLLRTESLFSGVIPQIVVVAGNCIGPIAHVVSLADFALMTEGSTMWLGGDLPSDAGTADYHAENTGVCDFVCGGEKDAFRMVRELLGYLPQNCQEKAPFVDTGDDPNRRDEEMLDVLPQDSRQTYDIHDLIEKIVDNGEFLEIKEVFRPNFVCGFARFGGRVAGICANNPDEMAGVLEPDSSDKYYRFMLFLDAFGIPILDLVDTTAFIVGDHWEKKGVLRHGSKLLYGYSIFRAPKVTVLLRRSYGGANLVMGGRGMRPDFAFAWPDVEMAPTGPDTVIHAVFNKDLEQAMKEGGKEKYDEVYSKYREMLVKGFSIWQWARSWTCMYTVHEIIDPRDTRRKICKALETAEHKDEWVELPDRKHGVEPF